MRIGIAGLGKMGGSIAARLSECGYEVIGWNRSSATAESCGLEVVESPVMLTRRSDVVISSLFDETAIKAVYFCDDCLLAEAQGKLFIEMSTTQPQTQIALAKAVRDAGAAFLECPVGGTTGPARQGQLIGLAGGEQIDFNRAKPILEKLCRRLELVGPVGSGALVKLAINLPLLVFWQSFGEALAILRGLEKDPAWMVQLFSETAGGANVLKVKAEAIVGALTGKADVVPTFEIDAMRKDLRLILEQGQAQGVVLPVATQALAAFDELHSSGLGNLDCAYAPAYWANKDSSLRVSSETAEQL